MLLFSTLSFAEISMNTVKILKIIHINVLFPCKHSPANTLFSFFVIPYNINIERGIFADINKHKLVMIRKCYMLWMLHVLQMQMTRIFINETGTNFWIAKSMISFLTSEIRLPKIYCNTNSIQKLLKQV